MGSKNHIQTDMKSDVFLRVLEYADTLADKPHFMMFGHGEPLLHPLFPLWWESAARQASGMEIQTNGIILTPDMSRQLHSCGKWRILRVSVDGPDAATYQAQRGADRFEQVCEHIREVKALPNPPEVTIECVVTRLNLSMASKMQAFADSLGCGLILASMDKVGTDQDYLRVSPEEMEAAGLPRHIYAEPGTRCRVPQQVLFVSANGEVNPCCALREKVLGNLSRQTVYDVLASINRKECLESLQTCYCRHARKRV
jgi:MoaA/NifB/PqqE/SkfB family radical SAM enzyme